MTLKTPEKVASENQSRHWMTVQDVQEKFEFMAQYPSRYGNHDFEDALYEDVLRAIAEGQCDSPQDIAKEALRTKELPFPRYTA